MPEIFGGTAEKRKPRSGNCVEPGHMLADRDVGAEQLGVDRPRADAGLVDIVAVDADQRGAVRRQPFGRRRGQERVVELVGLGPPMPVPAGVDQHRLAARRRGLRTHPRRCRCHSRTAAAPPALRGRRATPAAGARGRCPRHSDGRANRDRCRCWRPCRCGRSGRSSRRRSATRTLRASNNRRCAGPAGRRRSPSPPR